MLSYIIRSINLKFDGLDVDGEWGEERVEKKIITGKTLYE